ncbi:MAG: hypothetical protein EXR31_06750 [Betaproteobacteria bacterium]|nr:hypothetical protein [Betaproteobacteria bacterium]
MSEPPRHDYIRIRAIHVAVALSLLLHAVALWDWLPRLLLRPAEDDKAGGLTRSLAVRLVPPSPPPGASPSPPPAPMMQAQPSPAQRPSLPATAPRPRAAPRVLSLERQSPSIPAPAPAEAARAPRQDDLASYIEARRRARGADSGPPPAPPGEPGETEQQRHNRIVAENLGLNRTPSFGGEQHGGGGIFQITRMGYDYAEFVFFGWNRSINRNSRQTIEVARGDNPNMEIAVVRRMIAIIRAHEQKDFTWESQRLGRNVTLSARPEDNAGLEDFLMRDFFGGARR